MNRLVLGIVRGGVTDLDLAAAAERHPDVAARPVDPDDAPSGQVAGLVVDARMPERSELVRKLAERWRVPVLVATPITPSAGEAQDAAVGEGGAWVFSANPLRYWLHTRRMLEEVAQGGDPPQTVFAAWRFRRGSGFEGALPRILDYLGVLCGGEPLEISAMRREDPPVMLVSLRYPGGVIASLELGAHLPDAFPAASELVVECFCGETTYHCAPGNQAVTVEGTDHRSVDWSPDPADRIVAAFVDVIRRGEAPPRSGTEDVRLLQLCDEVRRA